MYAVMRQYAMESSQIDEVTKQAREGFVPLISQAPGFVSYTVSDAGQEGLVTISVFQDQKGAEESVRLAAGWVKDTLATLLPNAPRVTSGRVSIRHAARDFDTGYGVRRRYQFKAEDVEEITRRVETGLVPMLAGMPGYLSYSVVDTGTGEVVSLSAFESRETADASTGQSLEWVKANLSEFEFNPPEVTVAQIKLRVGPGAAVAH